MANHLPNCRAKLPPTSGLSLCSCYFTIFIIIQLFLILSNQVKAGSIIKTLPGYPQPLPFELETGYIGVDEAEEVQLFYYFVKSEARSGKEPLVLWITGGPGCSSLSAFFYEIGPLKFASLEYDGSLPPLVLNPYSWNKVANIIYLDLPVGTGFSYRTTLKTSQSTDLQACQHAYQFLKKWLIDHPEFISNPLYVGGDSYSGMIVPILTQIISDGNIAGIQPRVDLKGYILGNPKTFDGEGNFGVPFAHGMGIISDEHYQSLMRNCRGNYEDISPSNSLCYKDVQAYYQMLEGINFAHILEPKCDSPPEPQDNAFGERRALRQNINHDLRQDEKLSAPKCRDIWYRLCYDWANDHSVRQALHIQNGSIGEWLRCNKSLLTQTVKDSRAYHLKLSAKGYRSLIYSGDHDLIVDFLSTKAWIASLNFSTLDDWRPWMLANQVAGYTRTYSNQMTFATVKGAGHTAPEYKPPECLAMFNRWISHQAL